MIQFVAFAKETHCYAAQPAGPHSTFMLAHSFKSLETLQTEFIWLYLC